MAWHWKPAIVWAFRFSIVSILYKRKIDVFKMTNAKILSRLQEKKSLTAGNFTTSQVVPVHHCVIRTSPDTPPTGAPWYASQSTVTLAYDFRSLKPAAITHAVNLSKFTSSTHDTVTSWTYHLYRCDWQWSVLLLVCQDRKQNAADGLLRSGSIPRMVCEACGAVLFEMENLFKNTNQNQWLIKASPYDKTLLTISKGSFQRRHLKEV